MKVFSRVGLWAILALMFVLAEPVSAQPAPQRISRIEIKPVGPPSVSEALIRANIRVKEGDPYSPEMVDEDVRNLYATKYFYNIRVATEPGDDGVVIRYVVQGNPKLTDINIVGNKKFSRTKILRKVQSKVGEPLNEPQLFDDTLEIQKLYQKAGLQKSQIKYVLNVDEDSGRATVTFEITESPKIKIEKVVFDGASAFKTKKLRKTIKTRERWWMSWLTGSGVLKDDIFEEDKDKLAEFYRSEGYIDFEIKGVKFDYSSENKLVIRLEIYEGKQYRVGDIKFEGNQLYPTAEIARSLRMKVGEIYTPKGLRRDREAIEDFYGARGYIGEEDQGRILVRTILNPNTDTGTMDLVYAVTEGEKSYIEKIEIRGNNKTKDKVIRRELAVSPGEVFDMVKVKRSRDRLDLMGYFSKVEAQPEATDVPNRKNLAIALEETSTGDVSFGAGFSSVDSVVGFATFNQGNFDLFNPPYFTGGGQKFRLQVSVGSRRQDYELSFTEPWFLNRKLALDFDLYHREASYLSDDYDETRTGARIGLRRSFMERVRNGIPESLIGGISYTFENVGLEIDNEAPAVFQEEEGDRLVSKIGMSLEYDTQRDFLRDTRGNLIGLPSRGTLSELIAEVAGGPLAGDTDIYRLEAKTAWYFPGFFEKHVLEVRGRAGVVDSFGDSDRVPLFDRFFLGGAYSLRGFDFRDVGPKVADLPQTFPPERPSNLDEPIGGSSYMFGSIEYSLPIIERLRFAVFYDIGNVWMDAYDFDVGDYNDNYGLGIRINITPRMPLRLDYGIPITGDEYNDNSGRFNFSVGYKLRN